MDDVRIEETFWLDDTPKRLRHFKGEGKEPILEKEWYQNGQLHRYSIREEFKESNKFNKSEAHIKSETKVYFIQGNLSREVEEHYINNLTIIYNEKQYYRNGQLAFEFTNQKGTKKDYYFDMDGNKLNGDSAYAEYVKKVSELYKGEKGENKRNVYPIDTLYDE